MPISISRATRSSWPGFSSKAACIVLGGLILAPLAMAQSIANDREARQQVFTTTYSAASSIGGEALRGVTGVVNINIAAGDNNLQSNSGAIAIGSHALGNNIVVQQTRGDNDLEPDRTSVRIRDDALSQASGWISINQAAGSQNVQSNSMSVALGVRGSSLTSDNLSQVLSGSSGPQEDSEGSRSSQRKIEVESSAFRGTSGVVQVNQSAGTGNATSNSFGLRMGTN
ncbi:hypothetical protein [Billgrantia kenyensis]|uniref:Adhesin n=1 Tax=Billgrantia kenyensis TaxID=321266 RepID=A0A7W0ACD3_9GAMM|nr:hypothetical protein [Halomonas kenyensis]MBA2777863.1 hypothetical protein [Halomonas kenyensis]MCG6661334.1 hypothetical protein [Halomonas kenyensis]